MRTYFCMTLLRASMTNPPMSSSVRVTRRAGILLMASDVADMLYRWSNYKISNEINCFNLRNHITSAIDASFFLNSSSSAFNSRFSHSNWLHLIHFDLDPVLDCRDAFKRPVSSSSLSVIIMRSFIHNTLHTTDYVQYAWSAYCQSLSRKYGSLSYFNSKLLSKCLI